METLKIILFCLFLVGFSFAQTSSDFLKFKARVGFDDKKERITAKHFSEDGTKLTLIGLKTIQVWDVPNAKLLKSYAHEIVELDKFFGTFYQLSPDGSKIITLDSFGRDGDKKTDRVNAYVFDVLTGKRLAVLERPDHSVRFAFWSANGKTLVTFSGLLNQKQTEISLWDGANLAHRKSFTVDGFTWHYLSPDGARLYVGNGGQIKVLGLPAGPSDGDAIRVYNTRTGAVEKRIAGERRELRH
jgi:WD40 repeat protein